MARHGVEIEHDTGAVADHMAERGLDVTVDLGVGAGRFTILTNDSPTRTSTRTGTS